jgi:hypothetical protein
MRCTVNIYAYINHLPLNKVNHLAIINKPTRHRKATSGPRRTSTCSGQQRPLFQAFRGERALWGCRLFLVHIRFPNLTTRDESCNSQMFEGFSLRAWNKQYMTRAGWYLDCLVQPIHRSTPRACSLTEARFGQCNERVATDALTSHTRKKFFVLAPKRLF